MNADEVRAMAEDHFERRLTEESSAIRREMATFRQWTFAFWTGQCFAILGFLLLFFRNR